MDTGKVSTPTASALGQLALGQLAHHCRTAFGLPIAAVMHHGFDVDAFSHGDGDGGYRLFLGRMSPAAGRCRDR